MQKAARSAVKSTARFLASVFCFVVAGFLSGCAPSEPPADVTIINGSEPQSIDPAIITGQPELRISQGLFEGLTRPNPRTGSAEPGLAERWDVSTDGRVYTFHLRTNLLWSTGQPIRADDVVYSWIRALDPATAGDYAGNLHSVKNAAEFTGGKISDPAQVGITAPDPFTVRIELNNPTSYFLDICAMPVASVVPRWTIERYGDRWIQAKPLPSSGPFELGYWKLNHKVRLIKNSNYWDAANTQSDIIDILPTAAASPALNLYERGQADVVWDKELVPSELVDVLLLRPDFHTFQYLGTYFVRFNVTRKPFDDARVRRAMALALDKERMINRITRSGEQPASSIVPPGTANYSGVEGLSYNPGLARALLAEAGFPGGRGFPRFEYLFNSAAGGAANMHAKVAVELQQMWREELGIEMDLRQMEWKVYLDAQSQLDYHLSRSSWIGDYNDANTFLDLFLSENGNNRTGWKNPFYDSLIRDANATSDVRKREDILRTAETFLVREELPVIPVFFYRGLCYFDTNKIDGIYFNIVDLHPLQSIRKKNRTDGESGKRPGKRASLSDGESRIPISKLTSPVHLNPIHPSPSPEGEGDVISPVVLISVSGLRPSTENSYFTATITAQTCIS